MTRASSVASLGDHPDLEGLAEEDSLLDEGLAQSPKKKTQLTRDMLAGREVPMVGVGPDGKPVKRWNCLIHGSLCHGDFKSSSRQRSLIRILD
jgi:hypothetical protein